VIKSADECLAALKAAVLARHPYEVPELIVIAMDAIEGPYRDWLLDSLEVPKS
jgi:periplasmic divalent cation tolerance protein